MNLFEYIKSQLPQMPNIAIMEQLGATQKLIDYVKYTTWNTNLGMLDSLKNTDEPTTKTWVTLIATEGTLTIEKQGKTIGDNIESTKTYAEWINLFNNHNNYNFFIEVSGEYYPLTYEEDEHQATITGDIPKMEIEVEIDTNYSTINVIMESAEEYLPVNIITTIK